MLAVSSLQDTWPMISISQDISGGWSELGLKSYEQGRGGFKQTESEPC